MNKVLPILVVAFIIAFFFDMGLFSQQDDVEFDAENIYSYAEEATTSFSGGKIFENNQYLSSRNKDFNIIYSSSDSTGQYKNVRLIEEDSTYRLYIEDFKNGKVLNTKSFIVPPHSTSAKDSIMAICSVFENFAQALALSNYDYSCPAENILIQIPHLKLEKVYIVNSCYDKELLTALSVFIYMMEKGSSQ